MTTALDDRLVPRAYAIVQKYGKAVSFIVDPSATYDPLTGVVTGSPTNVSARITPPEPYQRKYVDGDVVQSGDAKTYLPALGLTFSPVVGMLIVLDGATWHTVSVGSIYTGELVALYEIQMRR